MAITISGENNNDRILASDGVIDQISGINIVGLITASHINVGSNIQLGNAGIITATTFVGNVTGNVNSTSPLLLQTGGSERFRITGNNELGIAGANYGSAGQVLTSGGSGSAVSWSTISTDLVNDSSPQLGADLDTNGFGILVDDNKVVNFGNQNDLMIYHTGTHGYIKNRTNNLYIMSTNTEYGIEVHGDGKVRLNYDNSPKIETTNTGAIVTGIITATSRVSLGNNTTNAVDLEFGTNRGSAGDTLANINWKWNNTYVAQIRGMAGSDTTNKDAAHLNFYTAAAGSLVERLRIRSDGNVGINQSNPTVKLQITDTSATILRTEATANDGDALIQAKGKDSSGNDRMIQMRTDAGADQYRIISSDTSYNLALCTGNAPRVLIAGNSAATSIGGANTFNAMLTTQGDISGGLLMLKATENTNRFFVTGNNTSGCELNLYDESGGQRGILGVSGTEFFIKAPNTNAPMSFYTHNGTSLAERMVLKSDGKVGMQVATPKSNLHVYGPGDIRIGSQYGGHASIAQQVSYSSGYTGVHWMFETNGQMSWSFDGVLIVHGTGGSSYGTEVTHIKLVYSRESGALDSGDTWRNGSSDYNIETLGHGQVGLAPSSGSFSYAEQTNPDGSSSTRSLFKLSWSASGQGVGVWSKLIGNFYWASGTSGNVEIQDKDGNIVFNSI